MRTATEPLVTTQVQVERIVRCPFSEAEDYAEDFFRRAAEGIELRVPMRDLFAGMGSGHARKHVMMLFERHGDADAEGRPHDMLTFGWKAGTRMFPDFHGTLRLNIASVHTTRIEFFGVYEPPFGSAGSAFDFLIGRRIAKATMRDLLRRLAKSMERREEEYRRREDPTT